MTNVINIKYACYYQICSNIIKIKLKDFHSSMSLIMKVIILLIFINQSYQFNQSICGYIEFQSLYYFVNEAKDNINIKYESQTDNSTVIYNLCQAVEYYCAPETRVARGSLIKITPTYCIQLNQTQIVHINQSNASQGIQVIYRPISAQVSNIIMTYPCNSKIKIGCPQVSSTTIWTFFQSHQLVYTIVIQVVGVIFMILGIYMYRVTIVLIGWATALIILLFIQQNIVFVPGVPDQVLNDCMMLTVICSFFVGYVLGYFPKSGLFCMGMWIGMIMSLTLNNVVLYLIKSNPANLSLYIVLPVLAVTFGILTLCIKKTIIIFATSFIGAYICLRALSWYLGAFPNEFLFSKMYQLGLAGLVDWRFYLYVIALFVLTASSSALQYWLFKKKIEITKQPENLDQHFNKMENKMNNQRQNLMEFKNIFKGNTSSQKSKAPRVLRRKQQDSDSFGIDQQLSKDQQSDEQNNQNFQEIKDSEEEQQKPYLKKSLLVKRKK